MARFSPLGIVWPPGGDFPRPRVREPWFLGPSGSSKFEWGIPGYNFRGVPGLRPIGYWRYWLEIIS